MKRSLALVFGLIAVLLVAPIARADFHGGKSPYRDVVAPLGQHPDIKPADDDGDHDDGDDHDGDANDGSHHDDKEKDSSDDHEDANDHDDDQADDHDDGDDNEGTDDDGPGTGDNPGSGDNPGTNPGTPEGPTTQSVPGNASLWLWVLLVLIAGAAVTTAYVLRRRKMRAR